MERLVTFSRLCWVLVGSLALVGCLRDGFVDDADGYAEVDGDGSDRFPAFTSGEDGGSFVVVDDGAPAPDPTVSACGFQPILGFGRDVTAAVFREGQSDVEDEGTLYVFTGRDPGKDFDGYAALEQVIQGST